MVYCGRCLSRFRRLPLPDPRPCSHSRKSFEGLWSVAWRSHKIEYLRITAAWLPTYLFRSVYTFHTAQLPHQLLSPRLLHSPYYASTPSLYVYLYYRPPNTQPTYPGQPSQKTFPPHTVPTVICIGLNPKRYSATNAEADVFPAIPALPPTASSSQKEHSRKPQQVFAGQMVKLGSQLPRQHTLALRGWQFPQ